MDSISFDRAAGYYDETRALPRAIADAATEAIQQELSVVGAEWVLDVGAGTGRMSHPLAANGRRVTGVDVSTPMLSRYREKLDQGETVDLVLGDATRLPFQDGAFRVALVVHLLHLVFDWKQAMSELRRVVEPDGIVLRQRGDSDFEFTPEHRESGEAWKGALERRGFVPRKRADHEVTNEHVLEEGGSVRTVLLGEAVTRRSERGWIRELGKRQHSNLWEIPDEIYWPAVAEYERWAAERFNDLDEERVVTYRYSLDVWRFGER